MGNTKSSKELSKLLIFPPTIRVSGSNGGFKIIFHQCFKGGENGKDFRFALKGIKPNVFCEMINKDNIVMKTFNGRNRGWTPNICVNKI